MSQPSVLLTLAGAQTQRPGVRCGGMEDVAEKYKQSTLDDVLTDGIDDYGEGS